MQKNSILENLTFFEYFTQKPQSLKLNEIENLKKIFIDTCQ